MSSQRVSGTAAQRTLAVLGSAVFFGGRPIYTGGARSMVDHGLAIPAAVPWSGADARHRRDNDFRRRAWAR